MSVALYDAALAAAGNLGFLAEAQVGRIVRKRYGNYLYGGFARDFGTKDGRRVMVVALTARHWADLLIATDLVDVISALETSLGTDFSNEEDRFEYREVLAGLFSRWFARNDLAAVGTALQGMSLLWPTSGIATDPMMHLIDQPGVGPHLAPGLPVTLTGVDRKPDRAPVLGEHTLPVLSGLGLSDASSQIGERHVISAG